jgi:transcriptional regulator with XRE-family HTH domain
MECTGVHSMDEQTASLATAIGARVRQERQARSWTLDQLAQVAGVSRRAVVNVEQGVANPSVGTLLRISDALGVGLPALVAPPETKPVLVTRAGDVDWDQRWPRCVGRRNRTT